MSILKISGAFVTCLLGVVLWGTFLGSPGETAEYLDLSFDTYPFAMCTVVLLNISGMFVSIHQALTEGD